MNDRTALSKFEAEVAKENADEIVKVMNGLRNYAQHFALAVHGYLLDRRRSSDGTFLEFEFNPYVYKDDLAKDRDFETILAQLPNLPDQLEIKPMVRSYVESLGRIHLKFSRNHPFATPKPRVEDAIQLKSDLLAAFEVDENGLKIGRRTTFLKFLDDYLRFLHGKNRDFAGFADRRIVY